MLEVGRVVRSGREQDDRGRIVGPRRRDRAEGLPELTRIILDPAHAALLEELGKHLLHDQPVLDHVADPGWAAAVVFEHDELAAGVADQVGADDVHVLLARRAEADHLGAEALRFEDQVCRDHPLLEDALIVVDIVQEDVERADSLDQAGLETVPLLAGDRSRDQVEGKDLLRAPAVGVDRESDAVVDERQVRGCPPLEELTDIEASQAIEENLAIVVALPRRGKELVPGHGVERVILKEQRAGLRAGHDLRLALRQALGLKHWTGGHLGHLPCSGLLPVAPGLRDV